MQGQSWGSPHLVYEDAELAEAGAGVPGVGDVGDSRGRCGGLGLDAQGLVAA